MKNKKTIYLVIALLGIVAVGVTSFIVYNKLIAKGGKSGDKNNDNKLVNPNNVPPKKPVGINTTDEFKKDYLFTVNDKETKLTYTYRYEDCEDELNPNNNSYCIHAKANINDIEINELSITLYFNYGHGDKAEAELFVADSLNLNNLSIIKGGDKEYIVLGTSDISSSRSKYGTDIVIVDENATLIYHLKNTNSNPGFMFRDQNKENSFIKNSEYYVENDKLIHKTNNYPEDVAAYINTVTVNHNMITIISSEIVDETKFEIDWYGDI